MSRRSIITVVAALAVSALPALGWGSADAQSGRRLLLMSGSSKFNGPGYPGFLPLATSTFAITNLFLQSNTFTNASWGKAGLAGPSAPTVTANNCVDPNGGTTGTTVAFPAVGSPNQYSIIYQQTSATLNFPYTADIYIKNISGGNTLWMSEQLTGTPGTFTRTQITTSASWQRASLSWISQPASVYVELGVDTRDTGQSAQPAQTVCIWNAQLTDTLYDWPYIATTTVAVTQNQVTPLPAGVAFRDFSSLKQYSGNPVLPQNTGAYNAGGTTNDYFSGSIKLGSTYYAASSGTAAGFTFDNIVLNSGSNILTMADMGSGTNPIMTATPNAWNNSFLLQGTIVPINGQYNLYYSAKDNAGNAGVGVAMATAITGPYTNYSGNPLIKTTTGSVMYQSEPCVITIGNSLYMYTAYNSGNGSPTILFYTSPVTDGINWTFGGFALYPGIAGVDWSGTYGFNDPRVFKNKHGFYEMVYTVNVTGGQFSQSLGYAVSSDGIRFFPYQPSALLAPSTTLLPGTNYPGDGVFFEDGTNFYITYDVTNGSTVATANGLVMPDH